ncbi:ATP binding L-PSP endoribonuclease family protein-like protein [Cucurbitaria berberidis CBS 394.84]|uniref:Diphthine--ammonia ligase n=1 Tax=Cucurbitaria berberidis CBS 394.84 TaxID=1168544 RepID=A0A9P4GI90_9PLEO|nr:ATP binding L-PSP endoribonuclease family protein-like protein [Cucurbitaria berberidis CBS 394.84]KAF1845666.1 ATP binding L-PSP endoribonuclease family protein-like protein [Cucurbitaria berberidis CBS 394.84]
MSSSLNVIALISGGKDSLYSILHCQANGHTLTALANLYPTRTTNFDEDINSYMYQTVGHSVIPLYEQALGIPLYRQEITGKTVDSSRDYGTPQAGQEQDETENLVPLLKSVMEAHPEANAVSTGAILSTYQRTRVESIALRLGLTPLSYLWQYPLLPPYTQTSLLHDMTAVGQEAIIIKTASGGLDESFLGFDVAHQRTIGRLSKAMSRFGETSNGAIVGEGGEFETLALDGPTPLWKKRIRIEPGPPGVMEGGQAVLKIQASTLEDKQEDTERTLDALRIPELFDVEFEKLLQVMDGGNDSQSFRSEDATLVDVSSGTFSTSTDTPISEGLPRNSTGDTPTVFTYSNLISDTRPSSSPSSPSRQLTKIFLRLDHVLTQWHVAKAGVNHCTLLLRNMADFTVLNPIYAEYFSDINPPARVTIAVGDTMPEGVDIMLSVVIDKEMKDRAVQRQGLHVQGRSYWAPANIGPYSQAISVRLPATDERGEGQDQHVGEVVYVAGQIPLIPASMEVYQEQGFRGQAILSLQHLGRIGRAKGVRWWTAGVGFIPASANAEEQVRIAQGAWKAIHTPSPSFSSDTDGDEEEEEDIDPWDRLNRNHTSTFNDNTYRSPLPDPTSISNPTNPNTTPIPPCFIAQVHSLPRGVDIEWSASGLTAPSIHFNRNLTHSNLTLTTPTSSRSRFYTLEIREQSDLDALSRLGEDSIKEWTSATLYAGRGFEGTATMNWRGVQWIPCLKVWGENGREVRAVLVGRVDGDNEREGSVM